jgi:hypothetical protein
MSDVAVNITTANVAVSVAQATVAANVAAASVAASVATTSVLASITAANVQVDISGPPGPQGPPGAGTASVTITAGEEIAAGDIIYVAVDGLAYKADATDATKEAVLICPDIILIGDTGTANPTGAVVSGFVGLTMGVRYFLSATTPGTFVTSIPSAAGEIVQQVGHAVSATDFYFSPNESILIV